jgi:hypothetical protein
MNHNEAGPAIKEDDLVINKNDDGTFLICNQKNFELKDCIINKMGASNFSVENSINPSYICYLGKYKKKEEEFEALIIKAEMFVDIKTIKVKSKMNIEDGTINISVTSKKKLEESENTKNIEKIEGIEGDIKSGDIIIDIKIKKNIVIDKNKRPVIKEESPGIKVIYFKIVDQKSSSKASATDSTNTNKIKSQLSNQ